MELGTFEGVDPIGGHRGAAAIGLSVVRTSRQARLQCYRPDIQCPQVQSASQLLGVYDSDMYVCRCPRDGFFTASCCGHRQKLFSDVVLRGTFVTSPPAPPDLGIPRLRACQCAGKEPKSLGRRQPFGSSEHGHLTKLGLAVGHPGSAAAP